MLLAYALLKFILGELLILDLEYTATMEPCQRTLYGVDGVICSLSWAPKLAGGLITRPR